MGAAEEDFVKPSDFKNVRDINRVLMPDTMCEAELEMHKEESPILNNEGKIKYIKDWLCFFSPDFPVEEVTIHTR